MGGVPFKVAVGAFLVWLSAQLGTFAQEILGKVRESVQASELAEIDRYVAYQSTFGDDPSRKAHAPADQAEFDKVVEEWLQASGNRQVARDRWDEPYVYFRVPSTDPRDVRYRITSKGPDRALGTPDDIILERENDHATLNRDPAKIADAAIEQKQQLDREVARRLILLLRQDTAKASPEKPLPRETALPPELVQMLKNL